MISKEITNKILDTFNCKDQERPKLLQPWPFAWNEKNWVVMVNPNNGFVMIEENQENKVPEPIYKGETHFYPDLERIIKPFNLSIDINIQDLKDAISTVAIVDVPDTEECEACDGDGKFDHYGEEYDCKSCNETGKVKLHSSHKELDPKARIRIFEHDFRPTLIQKYLLDTIALTNCQKLTLRYQGERLSHFELDYSIIVTICPLRSYS